MKITTLANPMQTVLLTSRARIKGKIIDNIMTIDWHTPLSFQPMLYAVSIGKTRFTLELIQASKVFAVNFMSNRFEKEILFCGRHSGRGGIDKFKETGLVKEEAEKINCPRIREALGFIECKVRREIDVGDHVLFVGEIVSYGMKKRGKRLYHLFDDKFTTTLK